MKVDCITFYLLCIVLIQERELELDKEWKRQQQNEDLRKLFARQANLFYTWLTEARTALVDSSGALETQLDAVKVFQEYPLLSLQYYILREKLMTQNYVKIN